MRSSIESRVKHEGTKARRRARQFEDGAGCPAIWMKILNCCRRSWSGWRRKLLMLHLRSTRSRGQGSWNRSMRNAFAYELTKRGFRVQRQVLVPIIYDGVQLEEPLRLDLLVEEAVIIE